MIVQTPDIVRIQWGHESKWCNLSNGCLNYSLISTNDFPFALPAFYNCPIKRTRGNHKDHGFGIQRGWVFPSDDGVIVERKDLEEYPKISSLISFTSGWSTSCSNLISTARCPTCTNPPRRERETPSLATCRILSMAKRRVSVPRTAANFWWGFAGFWPSLPHRPLP